MFTMLVSCPLHFSPYSASFFAPPCSMAAVTSAVQCTCDAARTTWPGHSRIHRSRGFVTYSATAFSVTSRMDTFMTSSNSSIQHSTAFVSAGSISLLSGTRSPSTEIIARIVTLSVNSTSFTASKHFFMNGWIFSGSFASERISSSSSLDRKKNRGNASFLVSRKSFRPFSTTSSSWFAACKSSSRFGISGASIAAGRSRIASTSRRQLWSIFMNAAPSVGICFMISSELKMGSK
mmetsp:Transcript_9298/g.39087  ORF Transcript_9298/g.39087 Transcript_9298/m.39087 type:complete len:235 (+) Transcript_9298:233-937(+)